ncbi:OmpA family protein [Frigidibacter albus]|uniref:OmpA family protein n=1 Tax=Frigidibacter albus TaxID=1465486 RepID=A0A6L8VIJ0_9RHOB|nr:OmpA family protein [Frigidibacter albus]MZQ89352.1 OmpA family protein [Frigidibacter albus]NBE31258.1 OmpA family protein [Frigidibacter albus]GGH53750.1 membrane protein [Frigidibacter albus]
MRLRSLIVFPLALTALVACDPVTELGGRIDGTEASFGNATMNNTMVQSGDKSYAIDLTRRFAAEVPAMVTFAFNSSMLDGNAQAALRKQADFIRQFPELRFRVYGHTDLVGSHAYNKALGMRRAQAVVAYLATQGVSRSRLEAVASFGKTQPLVLTQGPEQRNRRTVTEVSGFVANHPMVLNGKYAEVIFREYVASAVPASALGGGVGEGGGEGGGE